MEKSFKVPVYVENDANLAALAEHQFGAGRGVQSLIFFQLSNGVSAGIIIDHALYRGQHGAAGEIGFTVLSEENLSAQHGRKGPLENCVSIEAIRARAIAMTKDQPSSPLLELAGGRAENITAEFVCQCALNGDPVCSKIIQDVTARLGIAIANAALALDPQRIILGGGVCRLPGVERLFEAPILDIMRRLLPFSSPDFTISSLHDDAVVIGASYMAVESLLVGAYPYRITA
jgi:glucokinase